MKKITYLLLALMGLFLFEACNDTETYAEKKEKENAAINKYIADKKINVISEETFFGQNNTTDVSKNEWVLFNSSGVYMQIIDKGCGTPIKTGETRTVLTRFTETNLLTDSVQLTNNILYYSAIVDKMTVKNVSGSNYAVFTSDESVMAQVYSSTAVPEGWIVPFSYINLGRPSKEGETVAHVKLIVPSAKGQSNASLYTYPCLYDLYFEQGR